ncbi:MAG: hypothetical protein MUF72_03250 [Elainella sp. Prado103]|jgi:hypothetical protein|nr:hypothetical protein [Elainella sp. Prado103]
MQTSLGAPPEPPIFRLIMAMLLTGSFFCLTTAIVIHLYTQNRLYEAQRFEQIQQGRIDRAVALRQNQGYRACIAEAEQVPSESLHYLQAQTIQSECQIAMTQDQLRKAQSLADAGYLKDAIAELQAITDESVQDQVEQLRLEWSNRIFQLAETYYHDPNNRYEEAIQTAKAIGITNPLYDQVQSQTAAWRVEWAANLAHFEAAERSLAEHRYAEALRETQQLSHLYWKQKATGIVQQAQSKLESQSSHVSLPRHEIEAAPNGLLFSIKFLLPFSLWSLLTQSRRSR